MKNGLKSAAAWLVAATLVATPAAQAEPAKAPAAVAQPYSPAPAIWLLADADTRIYLLGTIHTLPPGFRWRSPAIEAAVHAADQLVVESYDEETQGELPEDAGKLLFLDTPRPLLERVPEDRRAALREAVKSGPLPLEAYDVMPTWAAAMLLGIAGLMDEYGVDDPDEAPGVEDWLESAFRDARKPIGQIEDPLAVLRSINDLPEEAQVELLVSGLEEGAEGSEGDPDIDAWAQGRVDELAIERGKDLPIAVFDTLVTSRNAAWAKWLEKRLETPGTLLVAVGAGHLAGDSAVQNMLQARGLTVERID